MNKTERTREIQIKPDLQAHFTFSIGDTIGVCEDSRKLHWHNELEICHVKQGTGKYLINGHEYSFEPEDVFIINNDEIHIAFDDQNLIMRVLLFSSSILWAGGPNLIDYEYVAPFVENCVKYGNKLFHTHPHIGEVIGVLDEIQKEFDSKLPKCELMIKALLMKLMTNIIRYFEVEEKSALSEKINFHDAQKLKDIAEYVEENYMHKIRLNDLAKTFNISISKLCSLFRRLSGVSPLEYVICLRVNAAKRVLISTDKKILDIAGDCGFSSISSFNKSFRNYTGISPREYRVK